MERYRIWLKPLDRLDLVSAVSYAADSACNGVIQDSISRETCCCGPCCARKVRDLVSRSLREPVANPPCIWEEVNDSGLYVLGCGGIMELPRKFDVGKFGHCPYCGKDLRLMRREEHDE